MKKISVFGIIIGVLVVIGAIIWTVLSGKDNTQEGLLVSLILTIASSLVSWAVSAYYSKESSTKENTRLIDRIGRQSSEKILNQSKQLHEIEQYLDEKQARLTDNADSLGAIYLESARRMLKLIRSSNNTYVNDWVGVVSESVGEEISGQRDTQFGLFEDIDRIKYLPSDERNSIEEKIKENSEKIPSYLVPVSNPKANHASVEQHDIISDSDEQKKGKLTIQLSEDSYKGHVVVKFKTPFSKPPQKNSCKIVSKPDDCIETINCFARTGTTYDFHVVIKSFEYNVPLKCGTYELEYEFGK